MKCVEYGNGRSCWLTYVTASKRELDSSLFHEPYHLSGFKSYRMVVFWRDNRR